MNAEAQAGLPAPGSSQAAGSSGCSGSAAAAETVAERQSSISKQLPLLQLQLQQLQRHANQAAPLASLDCSITEPISSSHTSVTCTPTLSGYFDCDELSDMVDDSLFEITNAGCLSRSVFGANTSDSDNGQRQQQQQQQHHRHHHQNRRQQQHKKSQVERRQSIGESQPSATVTPAVGQAESRALPAAPAPAATTTTTGARDQVAAAGVAVVGVDGARRQPRRASLAGREQAGREEGAGSATPTNEEPKCINSQSIRESRSTSSSSRDNSGSHDSDSVTPTMATPMSRSPPPPPPATPAAPMISFGAGRLAQAPTSQVAMLANYKPYDYSSTSSTPAQTRLRSTQQQPAPAPVQASWVRPPPPATSGGAVHPSATAQQQQQQQHQQHQQNRKSARLSSAAGLAGSRSAEREPPPPSSRRRAQRKTRSNPDVRDDDPDGLDNADADNDNHGDEQARSDLRLCETCRAEQLSRGPSSASAGAKKSKEKRKFTFSLFNLFTGADRRSPPSDISQDDKTARKCCMHMRASSAGAAATAESGADRRQLARRRLKAGPKAGGDGVGRAAIKSRDSIRLTNQRKQRNNEQASANNVRPSNSFTDFQQSSHSAELLLDFSGSSGASNNSNNNSSLCNNDRQYSTIEPGGEQASLSLKSGSAANLNTPASSSTLPTNASNNHHNKFQQQQQQHLQQRPTKSVKFTMLDRVMIMPPSSRGSGSNLPPADLLPSAPIIKRPVPKSSSYSQTESSRNLEEMLARYAGNEQLISEINEKLKLTETIASPKSALDNAQSSSSDNEQLLDCLDQEGEHHLQPAMPTTYITPTDTFNENTDPQQPPQQQSTLEYQSVANVAEPAELIMLPTAVANNNCANCESTTTIATTTTTISSAGGDYTTTTTTTTFYSTASDVGDIGAGPNLSEQQNNTGQRRRISNPSNDSHDTVDRPQEKQQSDAQSEAEEAGFSKDWLSKQRALA